MSTAEEDGPASMLAGRSEMKGELMPMPTPHRIAVIPGDGIGREVVPEGLKVLRRAAELHGVALRTTEFDWACWEHYEKHGQMLPEGWQQTAAGYDAIYFGAVGWPEKVPDHIAIWGSILQFRRQFDQYVNLRPVRLIPGVRSPLADKRPGDIDMLIVRENTEGEYSTVGGRMYSGTDREIAMQETVMSRHGIDRVVRYALELARSRPRRHLTSATKSNGISVTMPYWDERVTAVSRDFPDVTVDKYHIDILAARFVLSPERFDVVVASNLFGDILSDLGPACAGTIGIAPSGNINPSGDYPSLFEPVHGSAPDIAGQGVANPVGQIWAGAMMMEHLGETQVAASIVNAIEKAVEEATAHGTATPDLAGSGTTTSFGDLVADSLVV